MEAIHYSKIVPTYKNTWPHILQDHNNRAVLYLTSQHNKAIRHHRCPHTTVIIIWARWLIIISLWLFWCFGRTYYLHLQDGTWFRQMTICCSGQFPQRTLHNWHIVFHHMSNSLTWKLEALYSLEMSKQTSTLHGTNTQKMTLYEPWFA